VDVGFSTAERPLTWTASPPATAVTATNRLNLRRKDMVYVELDNPGEVGDYIEIIRRVGIHVGAIDILGTFLMQLDMTARRFPRGDARQRRLTVLVFPIFLHATV
jgi:hypothetical protein